MKSIVYKLRKYKGVTMKDLSQLANIKDSRLRILEKDTKTINQQEMYNISKALNCSVLDLIDLSSLDKQTLEDLKLRIEYILKSK